MTQKKDTELDLRPFLGQEFVNSTFNAVYPVICKIIEDKVSDISKNYPENITLRADPLIHNAIVYATKEVLNIICNNLKEELSDDYLMVDLQGRTIEEYKDKGKMQ